MSSSSRILTNPSRRSGRLIAVQVVSTFLYCLGLPVVLWLLGARSGLPLVAVLCGAILIVGLGEALLASRTLQELVVREDSVSVRAGRSALHAPITAISVARPRWLSLFLKHGSVLRSREHGLWVFVPASVAGGDELACLLAQR